MYASAGMKNQAGGPTLLNSKCDLLERPRTMSAASPVEGPHDQIGMPTIADATCFGDVPIQQRASPLSGWGSNCVPQSHPLYHRQLVYVHACIGCAR